MSFAASSMNPTATSGSTPRSRSVSYSRKPAVTTPTTPDRKATTPIAPPEMSYGRRRPRTKTTNVAGATAAPSRINDGTRFGFCVLINTRRTISKSTTPPTSTRTQAHRRVMPTSPPPGYPETPAAGRNLSEQFVHEAPSPGFARLGRLHHRVSGALEVHARVPRRRRIAAADVPAGQADPQMHPRTVLGRVVLAAARCVRLHRGRRVPEVLAVGRRRRHLTGPQQPTEEAQRLVVAFVGLRHGSQSGARDQDRHAGDPTWRRGHPIHTGPRPRLTLCEGDLAGLVRSGAAGRTSARRRDDLRRVLGRGHVGDAVPVRRGRPRGAAADAGVRRGRLAGLRPRRRPGPAVRLPRRRAVRPGRRTPVQPGQAAAGSVRAGDRRGRPLGAVAARDQRRRLGRCHAAIGRGGHRVRLGLRHRAADAVRAVRRLRDPREGDHRSASRRAPGAAWHVRRPGASRGAGAPHQAWGHRRRAAAGAPVADQRDPGRRGQGQLLGLRHDRLLRPARGLLGGGARRAARRSGSRVSGDGEGAPCGRPRGAARRGVQPHRRGQRARSDALLPRAGQRRLLPARAGRSGALLRHDGHRQQSRPRPPGLPAARAGLAAVLGDRVSDRRLPVRPGTDAWPDRTARSPACRTSSTPCTRTRSCPR